ncbi:hypothetical protein SBA4_4690007 [Candidatus Sulfopaludibacter sp. SbA4]|nr:hypothetical protein SBA4_4690007 [Candidatus Sulfopaludibacter sp. SbA4]
MSACATSRTDDRLNFPPVVTAVSYPTVAHALSDNATYFAIPHKSWGGNPARCRLPE